MPRSSIYAFPRAWATREDDPDGGVGAGETDGGVGVGETVGGEATVGDGALDGEGLDDAGDGALDGEGASVGGVELDGEGAATGEVETERGGEARGEVEALVEGGGATAVAAVTVIPNAIIGQCPITPQIK